MTTVVVRDGVMAADSLATLGGDWRLPGKETKIRRLRDGSLVGMAGDTALVNALLDWEDNPTFFDAPEAKENCEVLILAPDGTIWTRYSPSMSKHRIHAPFYAIGSGRVPALAALHMGASAERAVEVAIELDTGSGGPVQVERL